MPLYYWQPKVSPALLQSGFGKRYHEPCRFIVEPAEGGHFERIASIAEIYGGKVCRELRLIPGMIIETPYLAIRDLVLSPDVKKIWHDTAVHAMLHIAVPVSGGTRARAAGYTGKGVTVAVIDTGIAPHPDLISPTSRIVGWNDIIHGRPTPYDDNGHGTHVAGLIAGNGYASKGRYTGMAPQANLVGVKVLDENGAGTVSDVIAALEWCVNHQAVYGIQIINLSLGAPAQESFRSDPLCRATTAAWEKGILIAAAAGNDGPEPVTINTPGINPRIITVGNLNDQRTLRPDDDEVAESSSRGPTLDGIAKPDLLAPGAHLVSLGKDGGYCAQSGTSMAASLVAGAAALALQKNPRLKPDEIKEILLQKATHLDSTTAEPDTGTLCLKGYFQEYLHLPQNGAGLSGAAAADSVAEIGTPDLTEAEWKQVQPFILLVLIAAFLGSGYFGE